MVKTMHNKIILLLLILLSTRLANAQADFRPGYIIKMNGDTLSGEIDYAGDLSMGKSCRFRLNDEDEKVKYSPGDIMGYRFKDGRYFVSRTLNEGNVFLEFLIKGRINIYYLRDDTGDHYFLEKEDDKLIELPYEEEIRNKDGMSYLYRSNRHIGILNFYMQDAPALQSRIASMKRPEHDNLIKLAEVYHNTVCNDRACIVYEKKLPLLKVDLEVVGGIISFQNLVAYNNTSSFQGGVLMHFWMPRTNEKLFLRTGVLYSTVTTAVYGEKSGSYKIPLQIEYVYPKGFLRPKVAYGINFYTLFEQTVSIMGGINLKLHRSLYLSANYDIDFMRSDAVFLIPKSSIFSQSALAGLLIKF